MSFPPVFPGLANRIKRSMESLRVTPDNLAKQLGTSRENVHDLMAYDQELVETCTLGEALRLATILGLTLRELLSPGSSSVRRISFGELAALAKARISARYANVSEFEEKIGWGLLGFLDIPDRAADLPLPTVRDLCAELGLSLLDVLPE